MSSPTRSRAAKKAKTKSKKAPARKTGAGKPAARKTRARAGAARKPAARAPARRKKVPTRIGGARASATAGEKINGMGSEAVRAKTGKGWDEWFEVLDGARAFAWPHKEIARWLGKTRFTDRQANPRKSLRIPWPDETNVEVMFYAKGPEKSLVTVQHMKLAGAKEVAAMKACWTRVLAKLKDRLETAR